ncbi:MAG: energy transducer TonB [Janthinobacterium lividum]
MLLLPTFRARLLPCSESWAAMTPTARGRHCARCQRVVHDFTRSQNPAADLAAARAAAPDGRVCGRFAGAQVQGPPPLTRRLRWFLVALVLVVTQGLSAREALAQVQRGASHYKARVVKPVKQVKLLGDVDELRNKKLPAEPSPVDLDELTSKQGVTDKDPPMVFGMIMEQMPSFRGGGNKEIVAYIQQHVKYPNAECVGGKVFVSFVVDSTGRVQHPTIVKSLSPGTDAEVMRVIKTMDGFTPGTQNGKPVNVIMTVPISFKIE